MTTQSRRAACERAQVWASLLPDGELSLFEQRLLEAHCDRCADCRRVLESVNGITTMIRATPPEAMEHGVRTPRVRGSFMRSASGMLATVGAAALAVAVSLWVAPQHTPAPSPTVQVPVIVFTPQSTGADNAAIWQLKRTQGGIPANTIHGHRTGPVL